MASASCYCDGSVGAAQRDCDWYVGWSAAAVVLSESGKEVAAPTVHRARLDRAHVRAAGAGVCDSTCHVGDRSRRKFVYEGAVSELAI
jgi:hypothetical protein